MHLVTSALIRFKNFSEFCMSLGTRYMNPPRGSFSTSAIGTKIIFGADLDSDGAKGSTILIAPGGLKSVPWISVPNAWFIWFARSSAASDQDP